ncbi:MAG: phosphoribosylglycinamide formyltransferase [Gammaproteobacteria bacterium]
MSPRPALRIAVLVSGSGSNLQAIIDAARTGTLDAQVIGVISDRPGVLALERARQAGIPAITVDYKACGSREAFGTRLLDELRRLDPQLVVLAGFMRILPAAVVDGFRGRMLNVHPSLLPRYPGLDTYRRALAAGDAWHGSSVHFVIPELDAGPVILQYRIPVRAGDSEDSLRARVQAGEHRIYPRAIQLVAEGRIEYRDGRAWRDGQPVTVPEITEEDAG